MYKTREEWLAQGFKIIKSEILTKQIINNEDNDKTAWPKIRIACGFSGTGNHLNSGIGVCWYKQSSTDSTTEIFISPVIDQPTRVLDILIHELIHALRPTDGHRAPFKRIATAAGLTGKMTSTIATPELVKKLKVIAKKLGKYPHAKMAFAGGAPKGDSPGDSKDDPKTGDSPRIAGGKPKQSTRMVKAECSGCGFILRASRSRFEQMQGKPRCIDSACGGSLIVS